MAVFVFNKHYRPRDYTTINTVACLLMQARDVIDLFIKEDSDQCIVDTGIRHEHVLY